jgi:hypothetical protein
LTVVNFILIHRSLPFLSLPPTLFAVQYRAKNDIYNSMSAGFVAGGILARNSGPKAMIGGGLAFSAFSTVIDILFIRRETPEYVHRRCRL